VRMETDIQNNPWGLGFNCYSSIPLRLEAKEFRERYFEPGQRNRTVIFNYDAKEGSNEAIHEKISDICIFRLFYK